MNVMSTPTAPTTTEVTRATVIRASAATELTATVQYSNQI